MSSVAPTPDPDGRGTVRPVPDRTRLLTGIAALVVSVLVTVLVVTGATNELAPEHWLLLVGAMCVVLGVVGLVSGRRAGPHHL